MIFLTNNHNASTNTINEPKSTSAGDKGVLS